MQNIADRAVIQKHNRPGRLLSLLSICLMIFLAGTYVQGQRSSVSAAEVTGSFRHSFTGKFKGSSNDIKIASAGKGKLHIGMDLVYPYMNGKELMANTGELDGQASIDGDTAVYTSKEFGPCTITIKFTKPGVIDVKQDEGDCGFGHNVSADGHYVKVSSRKPTFK